MKDRLERGEGNSYRIQIEGQLDKDWSAWFDGLAIAVEGNVSTLTAADLDQAALRGILCRLWDLNLVLISVIPLEVGPSVRSEAARRDGREVSR
ncbi:MAG: hypothetical protein ACK2UA_09550 [Anaerolineae bacterium]|jgi:hypothetical protein